MLSTAETLLSQFRKCFVDAILPNKSFSIGHTESKKLLSSAELLLSLLKNCLIHGILHNKSSEISFLARGLEV